MTAKLFYHSAIEKKERYVNVRNEKLVFLVFAFQTEIAQNRVCRCRHLWCNNSFSSRKFWAICFNIILFFFSINKSEITRSIVRRASRCNLILSGNKCFNDMSARMSAYIFMYYILEEFYGKLQLYIVLLLSSKRKFCK